MDWLALVEADGFPRRAMVCILFVGETDCFDWLDTVRDVFNVVLLSSVSL